jgi:hypothetical protein
MASVIAIKTKFRGLNSGRELWFLRAKNPRYAFLQRSKAVGPM